MNSTTFIVTSPLGLHARPCAYIVLIGNHFFSEWEIVVTRKDTSQEVDAKSIMALMMLAVPTGTEIEFLSLMPDDDWRLYVNALGLLFYSLSPKSKAFRDNEYGPIQEALKQAQKRDKTASDLVRRLTSEKLRFDGRDIVNAVLFAEEAERLEGLKSMEEKSSRHQIIIHGNVYGAIQFENNNALNISGIVEKEIADHLDAIRSYLQESEMSKVDFEEAQFIIDRLKSLSKEERTDSTISHITKHLTNLKNIVTSVSGLYDAVKPLYDKLCSLFVT